MFTGLVQQKGSLAARLRTAGGWSLQITAETWDDPLQLGESIAVQGACLTVTKLNKNDFNADLLDETLQRTTLGRLAIGAAVNLERAVRPSERMGGHLVAGHVDETGRIAGIEMHGRDRRVIVQCTPCAARQSVLKGSITLDGISLTLTGLGENWLSVDIIPHTWQVTSLSERQIGDSVNIETDIIGKYVERLLGQGRREGVTPEKLAQAGFL